MSQKVSIRYLIDVAIGNPEPGIVNFNALYTVLQAISEKLALQDENVEIDSSFCPISTNIFDSKSNVSSEKLVDHQIFDFNSDATATERIWDAKHRTPRSEMDLNQVGDDRKVGFESGNEDPARAKKEAERLTNYRSELRQHIDALNARLGKIENTFAATVQTDQHVECLRCIVDQFQAQLSTLQSDVENLKEVKIVQEGEISACRKKLEHDRLAISVDGLRYELDELRESIAKGLLQRSSKQQSFGHRDSEISAGGGKDYSMLQDQLMEVRTNICNLTEQLQSLEELMSHGKRGSSVITITTFEKEMANIKHIIEAADAELTALKTDNTTQKTSIEDLTVKLEELAKTKIDKEEIDELLSEKADYTMLQRKVSVENMDAERRKLEKQLTEITDCFVLNEEHVQKQISDIKKFLGDQSIEDMFYDFKVKIDKDFQTVRDGIRRVAEMKVDKDAAAARLRDLSCLSCDQEVVMKAIEMNNLSKFGDAYVSRSISPNITFEIGKLREAGKIGPGLDLDDELCDMARNFRHTGGLHTIVTNKDRVERTRSNRHNK